jgi:hypothetical protein
VDVELMRTERVNLYVNNLRLLWCHHLDTCTLESGLRWLSN